MRLTHHHVPALLCHCSLIDVTCITSQEIVQYLQVGGSSICTNLFVDLRYLCVFSCAWPVYLKPPLSSAHPN